MGYGRQTLSIRIKEMKDPVKESIRGGAVGLSQA